MSVSTKTSLEFVAFDGSQVKIEGQFLVGHCSDGSPSFLGYAKLSEENREALKTINHGSTPEILVNDKGEEQSPEIADDPMLGIPLWKYVKPGKKDKTPSKLFPVQSAYNRETKFHQVTTLKQSLKRKGWDTKVRVVSIVTKDTYSTTGDAGHLMTALAQLDCEGHDFSSKHKDGPNKGSYVNALNESNVIILQSLNFMESDEGTDNTIEGFDELQSSRTIKDILGKLGLAQGWESDCQIVISALCLLCSGKTVGSSGKYLPHIIDDAGKPRKLAESESAGLFTKSIPGFERIRLVLDELNRHTIKTIGDDKTVTETPLWDYPTIQRYSIAAWVLAIIEVSYSVDMTVPKIVKAIHEHITDDLNPITSKVNAWAAVKGRGNLDDQYPVLCSIIFAYMGSDLPTRKPISRSTCLVKIAYDSWRDKQA